MEFTLRASPIDFVFSNCLNDPSKTIQLLELPLRNRWTREGHCAG